ncbi:MAG: exodeoxyribonuclease III [Candidatus Komeilibacteria bacterium]
MKLISWNVNGIRAAERKGFLDWLYKQKADIIGVQETKAHPEQLSDKLLSVDGYHSYWASAQRKGYSGVAVWTKQKPIRVTDKLGKSKFDNEGRVLRLDYPTFVFFNVYFPNGGASVERLQYKMEFYQWFLAEINKVKQQGKNVIFCGDVNTAHQEIDLARPKENSAVSGFLPQERAWLDQVESAGYIDSFRYLHPQQVKYSWWDYKTRARERNVGWRIDYFFVNKKLARTVKKAAIDNKTMGSDHCPVILELDL